MSDFSVEGKTHSYEFGYLPRDEKIPEGWVKTIRPCMGCSSSVTYIDKDKIWHCLKCGWSSDTVLVKSQDESDTVSDIEDGKEHEMAKVYTKKEVELIAECIDEGMIVKQIAEKLERPYQGVWAKVKEVKKMIGKAIVEEPTGKEPEGEIVDSSKIVWDSKEKTIILDGNVGNVTDFNIENPQPTEGDLSVQQMRNVDYTRPYPTEEMEQMQKQIDDLQVDLIEMEKDLNEANRKLENAEANNKDLLLHTKGLQAEVKFYLDEANSYSLKLHEANELVTDLEKQLKYANERIVALEAEPLTKSTPHKPQTTNERVANALLNAQDAGMELSDISWTSSKSVVLSFILRVSGKEESIGDSINNDETELPF